MRLEALTGLLLLAVAGCGKASQPGAPAAAPEVAAVQVIQDYSAGLAAVRAPGPEMKLAVVQDAQLPGEAVLQVEYPAPAASGDMAARDVRCDAQQSNWSSARAVEFRVKPEHDVKISISFFDRNLVAYTTWRELRGGAWQPVRVAFDEIQPNPYFQRPDAKQGQPIDVSEVKGMAFSPQSPEPGRLLVSKLVLAN